MELPSFESFCQKANVPSDDFEFRRQGASFHDNLELCRRGALWRPLQLDRLANRSYSPESSDDLPVEERLIRRKVHHTRALRTEAVYHQPAPQSARLTTFVENMERRLQNLRLDDRAFQPLEAPVTGHLQEPVPPNGAEAVPTPTTRLVQDWPSSGGSLQDLTAGPPQDQPSVGRKGGKACRGCRRRKGKCEELQVEGDKARCKACVRSGEDCVWPEDGERNLERYERSRPKNKEGEKKGK